MAIPMTHYKVGLFWAWLKGRPLATLASDVFQARTENADNVAWIRENLAARAADLGITPEQLEAQILNEAGFNPADGEVEE